MIPQDLWNLEILEKFGTSFVSKTQKIILQIDDTIGLLGSLVPRFHQKPVATIGTIGYNNLKLTSTKEVKNGKIS